MRYWLDKEKKFKQLINVLRDPMTKDKNMEVHTHDFVEIEYILSGEGVQIINDKAYKVQRGDIIYLKKGDYHTYRTDDRMEVLNIVFYYSVFDEMRSMLRPYYSDENMHLKTIMHLHGADMLYVEELLLKAEKEFKEEQLGYYHVLKSYLSVLLIFLLRISSEDKSGKNFKLPAILEYIDRNYSDISVQKVADHFGYSANYFSKLFKNNMGISFVEYITNKRMNKAVELLVSTNLTIDAICSEIGLSDRKHFYELFHKYFGMTPAAFRNNKNGLL